MISTTKEYRREYRLNIRRAALKKVMYGLEPLCIICGEDFYPFLQIDHVNNDGAKWRKIYGRDGLYLHIVKWWEVDDEQELQILCANCNDAKRRGCL